MAELLLELFSEEIPARMQARAAEDLKRLVEERLGGEALSPTSVRTFAGPRRLTLLAEGVPARQPERREEKKGPKVGAPDKAVEGFLRSVGLASLNEVERRTDPKGDYYVAVLTRPGVATADVIARFMPEILRAFPWPKSMRWGAGTWRWVRPLRRIVCLLDGDIVPFTIEGVTSGRVSEGHRVHAPAAFPVTGFADYAAKLLAARVVLDAAERKVSIAARAQALAQDVGGTLIPDEALLEEVAGLVEWPVVLRGRIDEALVRPIEEGGLPPEVLTTAMRTHQKYFSVRDSRTGRLAPHFVLVANLDGKDGGRAIIAGNERVLRARLADAKFFWDQDRKKRLEARVPALANIVFHAALGTLQQKSERVARLAREIAQVIHADPDESERAARLAKADLTTAMVGEFPELQGLMGRYYALADGVPAPVADAIEAHYQPLGPSDDCPSGPVAVAVALADKIDSLVGFFAIGEKPTGSKDPYALRRAALGVIRLILENVVRLNLRTIFGRSGQFYRDQRHAAVLTAAQSTIADETKDGRMHTLVIVEAAFDYPELLEFFVLDRLKVALRGSGVRHDLVDAVFAQSGAEDLILLVKRVEALQRFLATEDGANLLAGYRRAVNILRIEEAKDRRSYEGTVDPDLLTIVEEKGLFTAFATTSKIVVAELERERDDEAMAVLARLRGPVDRFFDKVTVNAPDAAQRENRLRLLSQIRATLHQVADFSKIEG